MTRLDHNKIYTITELAKVQFPKSLDDMSSFCCLKNLQVLAQITNTFWNTCKRRNNTGEVVDRIAASNGIGFLQSFVDPHRNKDRECADFFGY